MSEKQTAIEFLEYQREVIKETVISADHIDLKNIDICIELIKGIGEPVEAERGTVQQLHNTLSTLISEGVGCKQIKAWDPDSETYQPITSATYAAGGDEPVKLWTDDID